MRTPVLGSDESARLRERLLSELADIGSAEEAAEWAHRALGLKNTLTGVDAGLVEDAFQSKLAGLTANCIDADESPAPSAAAISQGIAGVTDAQGTKDA